ncbi:MAG: TIGR03435 family protein [Limisphaerales bacterium]
MAFTKMKRCVLSLPEPETYTVDRSSDNVIPNQTPALFEISIRGHPWPSNDFGPHGTWSRHTNGCEFKGQVATVESALHSVFDKSPARTSIQGKLPDEFYDFQVRAPLRHAKELQHQFSAALRTVFGLDVKQTTKTVDAYLMTQINTNASGLRRVEESGGGGQMRGGFKSAGADMKGIAESLEWALKKPVFDETGLRGFFYVNMKWKLSEAEKRGDYEPDADAVIAAASERLGLKLTPVQRPVEVLEVSKASEQ